MQAIVAIAGASRATSEENVELARHAYEAFNRGDLEDPVADFAPAFEYVSSGAIPGSGRVYRGAEGWKESVAWVFDEFDDAHFEIHELIDAGDQVLAALTMWGRGKQSGRRPAGTYGTSGLLRYRPH